MGSPLAYIEVTAPGSGYTAAPTVAIDGGGGASAVAEIQGDKVLRVKLVAVGSYEAAPGVSFSGGAGSGTVAIAVLAGGAAYANVVKLSAFIGAKALRDLSAETGELPDDKVLFENLVQASNFMNGYLRKYRFPITDPAALSDLEVHCLQVARWYVWGRRTDSEYYNSFRASEDWLKRVMDRGGLGNAPLSPPPVDTVTASIWGGSDSPIYGGSNRL